MNQLDLKGRVAVITGGAQGIGYSIAERMLDSGAAVSLWDINEQQLGQARAALASRGKVATEVVEITDDASVDAATRSTLTKLGRLDALVNSAGITGGNGTTWELSPDVWRRVLEVNLVAPYLVCRAIVPHLIGNGYGRIVNVASIAGKEGNPNASHYSASKAGLIGFTHWLASYFAKQNITANALAPALVESDMVTADLRARPERIPIGRFGKPDELGALAVAVLSNGYITGQTINHNGGLYMAS